MAYLRDFPGVREYRKRLVSVESIEDLQAILADIRVSASDRIDMPMVRAGGASGVIPEEGKGE